MRLRLGMEVGRGWEDQPEAGPEATARAEGLGAGAVAVCGVGHS